MTQTQNQNPNSTTNPDMAAALLFLHAQTGLHAGSGTALGTIDLPIQRERHTDWPLIPGPTMKGVLRDSKNSDRAFQTIAFGPRESNGQNPSDHAGAAMFTDARLIAFPVRSLCGVFAWVTCPAALDRLERDAKISGITIGWNDVPAVPNREECLVNANSPLIASASNASPAHIVLEEFQFERTADVPTDLAKWFADNAIHADAAFNATRNRLKSQLVVLHDDDFTHFVRHATEICARIALIGETKTVKKGALFYEEFLPAESLLYSVVVANKQRGKIGNGNGNGNGNTLSGKNILDTLTTTTPMVLQFGGDETVGKGVCVLRWAAATAKKSPPTDTP